MTLAELVAELEQGRLRPGYLLAGPEPLLRDEALAAIRAAALEGGPEDFNLDRFDGSAISAQTLENAVDTLPVMASRRLVILTAPEGRLVKESELLDRLGEVVQGLRDPPDTVLVVIALKPDKRLRWVKAFRNPAVVVECEAPKQTRQVVEFIQSEADRLGLDLAPSAARELAEQVGPQLLLLRQEIEKLSLMVDPGERAEREHVGWSTHAVSEQPIWDLTDAIGEGRIAEAVSTLGRIVEHGAPSPVVLASLATHFRLLLRTAEGVRVPRPPFVVKKLQRQAGRYSMGRLEACLGFIHRTDTAIKGAGSLAPELALERLVIALAS